MEFIFREKFQEMMLRVNSCEEELQHAEPEKYTVLDLEFTC